jgi:3-oxoacyl-[acyl-carrier-protein] synthase II
MGAITPLGQGMDQLMAGLREGRSGVRRMPGWEDYLGMRSLVAAPAELPDVKSIPRQKRRSMGRISLLAAKAAEEAVADAGIDPDELAQGRVGCIVGSTMGGAEALNDTFETMLPERDLSVLQGMSFFKCVSHTAAMNVAQYFGITGTVMATSSACASSLQATGAGYDLIRVGRQDVVLCGGSEEAHPTVTGCFDILFATSCGFNDRPAETPRPFDRSRDGLVCGEGAGILVLEEYEHARRRGAQIHAEVVGYATFASGDHVSQSSRAAIGKCMRAALSESGLDPSEVGYVSAHATGTPQGDAEEARAIGEVFGDRVPVSSLKGHLGHTLGASGAIELAASLCMMRDGVLIPTLNLDTVDDACAGIAHVQSAGDAQFDVLMKNCFAFGGINASLVCVRDKGWT